MNENKEEIRYILKFYYKKERMWLLKKFVIFMDIMQYQYAWHKADSSVFNIEILISKMHLTLVDQSLEKSMKSWKKLSKSSNSALAVMISIRN